MTCFITDEEARLQIVLRISKTDDDFPSLLPQLTLSVNANATDAIPAEGRNNVASASGKHDLASKTYSAAENVDLVSVGEQTYAVWKPIIHLVRPRARLQRPAVYFTAILTLSTEALNATKEEQKDFLKSYQPLPANVLDPLRFDPSLSGSNIYLSEQRITKVAPPARRVDVSVKPIRGASKRAFSCVPALFTRLNYSPLPDASIASLHVETSNVIAGSVSIQNVSFEAPEVSATSLNSVAWPQSTHAGDEVIVLYRLEPRQASFGVVPVANPTVTVSITATAELDQGSKVELNLSWQNPIDLKQSSKPKHEWSRPLSTSLPPHKQIPHHTGSRPTSSEGGVEPAAGESSIIFNFTAPPTVKLHTDFPLEVQCINRSNCKRRFALVVLQSKSAQRPVGQQPQPTVPSDGSNATFVASSFDAPPLKREKRPDVLVLNPDCRIGPLPPGACFETEMRFRVIAIGVLNLGTVRVYDLDTRQTVDVKELPDVVALERSEGID